LVPAPPHAGHRLFRRKPLVAARAGQALVGERDERESGQQELYLILEGQATFELDGQPFMALNGGPLFKFTEAISLFVNCETQAEVDELWENLSAGGQKSRCGWLKDKFGVFWQVNPAILGKMLSDPDPAKSGRVMQAMLKMKKIEIEPLKKAYAGK
jgi:predicted 3-demethylubiquinone-9 3-methyltransferase (glyoxalase superfamily)